MSLLFSLNEHTFHTLAVVASGIQRVLVDIVAVSLKAVNNIQIDNLRPVDAHEVRMLRQHLLNPPQPMVHHLIPLTSQEHDASILEGSHPQNLVIPHLRPTLIGLHEEAVLHYSIHTLLKQYSGSIQGNASLLTLGTPWVHLGYTLGIPWVEYVKSATKV